MANKRNQKKGDSGRDAGGFVALPWAVLDCRAYARLTHPARSLLMEFARQFVKDNNGRLLASRAHLAARGWKSHDVIQRATQELVVAGFIHQTVIGHRPNKASWYAVTWRTLDRHPSYDPGAVETFRRGAYAQNQPIKSTSLVPSRGTESPAIGPSQGLEGAPPVPPHGAERAPSVTPNGHQNQPMKNASLSPPDGLERSAIGPSGGLERAPPSPSHGPIRGVLTTPPSPSDGHHLEKPSAGSSEPAPTDPARLTDRPDQDGRAAVADPGPTNPTGQAIDPTGPSAPAIETLAELWERVGKRAVIKPTVKADRKAVALQAQHGAMGRHRKRNWRKPEGPTVSRATDGDGITRVRVEYSDDLSAWQ